MINFILINAVYNNISSTAIRAYPYIAFFVNYACIHLFVRFLCKI